MAVFRGNWTIAILGDYFTYNDILQAIYAAGIPNCISFKYDSNPTGKYKIENWTGWGPWPFPIDSVTNYVIIFSSQDPRFAKGGYGGGTIGSRCSVQVWPNDSKIAIGQRIWHEILHGMSVDTDQATNKDVSELCSYLQATDSKFAGRFCNPTSRAQMTSYDDWHEFLCEYNTFLMKKHFPNCFSGTTPVAECSDGSYVCEGYTRRICSGGKWVDYQANSPLCGYVIPAPVVSPPTIIPPAEPIEPDIPPDSPPAVPAAECLEGSFTCAGTTRKYCSGGKWVDYQYSSPLCGYVKPAEPTIPQTEQPTNVVYITPQEILHKTIYVIEEPQEMQQPAVVERDLVQTELEPVIPVELIVVAIGGILLVSLLS